MTYNFENRYPPEGTGIFESELAFSPVFALNSDKILTGRCFLCDREHNLHVKFGAYTGIIPRDEAVYSPSGEPARDIALISRVGKTVCFKIIKIDENEFGERKIILSRKEAQRECCEEYLKNLISGDIIDACVTHLEPFGAFLDIGCGFISLLPIDCISVSRISHPKDRLRIGQKLKVVVKSAMNERGQISVTHRELLGSWEENAAMFNPGECVDGIIRSAEPYGIFVELTPNLAGLAEVRKDALPGMHAGVYIKSIIPEKMKIKLIIIDVCKGDGKIPDFKYFLKEGENHIDYRRYSPLCAQKCIEAYF